MAVCWVVLRGQQIYTVIQAVIQAVHSLLYIVASVISSVLSHEKIYSNIYKNVRGVLTFVIYYTWNLKGFYLKPKSVLPPGTKKGFPMGTAEEPFWNPFFCVCSSNTVPSLGFYVKPICGSICEWVRITHFCGCARLRLRRLVYCVTVQLHNTMWLMPFPKLAFMEWVGVLSIAIGIYWSNPGKLPMEKLSLGYLWCVQGFQGWIRTLLKMGSLYLDNG
jgi:hypothetical protein